MTFSDSRGETEMWARHCTHPSAFYFLTGIDCLFLQTELIGQAAVHLVLIVCDT